MGAVAAYVGFNSDEASRPSFLAAIYPGLGILAKSAVPADAPPLFVAAASDDPLGLAPDALTLYRKWLDARKSAELHMYAEGGHGFGMRKQGLPSDAWPERFHEWLLGRGLVASNEELHK